MATGALSASAYREVRRHSSHLRSSRFLIFVMVATATAALLAYLGRTVGQLPMDLELTRWIQALSIPGLGALLQAIAWVGFPPQSNIVWGVVILGLFLLGLRLESAMLAFSAVGSAGLWFLIVPLVDRPRPSPDLVHVATQLPTGSFPSGHVLNLTAIFGFLIFLSIVTIGNALWRRLLVVLLSAPVLTIGVSRVYDGAHWPTDVLGGYLIGGVWLALSIALYREAQAWLESRSERTHAS
ncbi:MAG: phosphatase PAP2 family protein [Chloroflexi bacterium]|nr:phosphatase PAP2 family protein [Chloroflexota bacterium]